MDPSNKFKCFSLARGWLDKCFCCNFFFTIQNVTCVNLTLPNTNINLNSIYTIFSNKYEFHINLYLYINYMYMKIRCGTRRLVVVVEPWIKIKMSIVIKGSLYLEGRGRRGKKK